MSQLLLYLSTKPKNANPFGNCFTAHIFLLSYSDLPMKSLLLLAILVASVAAQAVAPSKYCKKGKGVVEIIMRPPALIEVQIGDTVSIACAAHGHGTADPTIHWVKGLGADLNGGKHMGPVATGKSVLWIASITDDDVDTYKCVVQDCCTGKKEEVVVVIKVPDDTCADVYGIGHVVYGAVWTFTNWTDAVASCERLGMEIAFPTSPEENAQLLSDIQSSFDRHPNARKFDHDNWVWIGAHDSDVEGTWVIQTTGEQVEWFNWGRSQPDNWKKYGNHLEGQDCTGIFRLDGTWDDSFNHYNRPYVCLCPEEK